MHEITLTLSLSSQAFHHALCLQASLEYLCNSFHVPKCASPIRKLSTLNIYNDGDGNGTDNDNNNETEPLRTMSWSMC